MKDTEPIEHKLDDKKNPLKFNNNNMNFNNNLNEFNHDFVGGIIIETNDLNNNFRRKSIKQDIELRRKSTLKDNTNELISDCNKMLLTMNTPLKGTDKNSFKSDLIMNIDAVMDNKEKKRKIRKIDVVCDSLSDDEEELELKTDMHSIFLIHTDSKFKYYWNIIIIIITIYSLIITPYYVAFGNMNYISTYILELIFVLSRVYL